MLQVSIARQRIKVSQRALLKMNEWYHMTDTSHCAHTELTYDFSLVECVKKSLRHVGYSMEGCFFTVKKKKKVILTVQNFSCNSVNM